MLYIAVGMGYFPIFIRAYALCLKCDGLVADATSERIMV